MSNVTPGGYKAVALAALEKPPHEAALELKRNWWPFERRLIESYLKGMAAKDARARRLLDALKETWRVL